MANKTPIEVVAAVVELLTPLAPEDRSRVANAALSLLGSPPAQPSTSPSSTLEGDAAGLENLPPRARTWARQYGISADQLNQVFHVDSGEAEVIASGIPGKSSKEQTYSAYILIGLAKLISSGSPTFDDKSARAFCKSVGCFNEANHSAYLASKGNGFTGSKEKGWTLTAPGLKRGALLIKELSGNDG